MTTIAIDVPKSLWLSLNDEPDRPCERCVFIPTPGGKCICEVPR